MRKNQGGRTAVQLRKRKHVTDEELERGLLGLLRVSVDVLRLSGDVRIVDRRWIDEHVGITRKEMKR
jgi:hypothetical protein